MNKPNDEQMLLAFACAIVIVLTVLALMSPRTRHIEHEQRHEHCASPFDPSCYE